MHRLLAAFISVILGTFGCGHVSCEVCPDERLQLRSESQHVIEMTLGGVCADALVHSSSPMPDGGLAGFVPGSERYWVDVARPGICTVDVVFDSGSTAHVEVLTVQTTPDADDECDCPTHVKTSDGNPVNLDYIGPG
jgi:hypothetical protein